MPKRKRDENIFIRPSSLSNYILNDKLADYLKIDKTDKNPSIEYIMNQGNIFEEELIKIIKTKHNIMTINTNDMVDNKSRETIELMEAGHNIIYQGYLYDKINNIGGSPDLLVKSTYVNKLMDNIIILQTEQRINDKEYYVVIDIKHSHINYDSFNYIKNDKRIAAYKAQLYLYTKMLNQIQNIPINRAYIWGKSYKCGKDDINFMNNLGTIDYDTVDKKSVQDAMNAIKWLRELHSDYHNITIINDPELFPNMKMNTFIKEKNIINKDIDDITTIWYCGIKKRKIAHDNNIFSWRDNRLTAELMGFKNKQATIINNILDINRQDEIKIKIVNSIKLFNDDLNISVYLDFEGFDTSLQSKIKAGVIATPEYYIYMIGIGYLEDNKWCYKSFIMEQLNKKTQNILFKNLFYFLKNLLNKNNKNKINLIHWSNYEKMHFNKIKENVRLCLTDKEYDFIDLCKIFQDSVVIKDAFNFKLKHVAKALYQNNLISTHYDTTNQCADGLDASILAMESYQNNNKVIMKDIEKYNEIDCKLLYDLHKLLQDLSL